MFCCVVSTLSLIIFSLPDFGKKKMKKGKKKCYALVVLCYALIRYAVLCYDAVLCCAMLWGCVMSTLAQIATI